MYYIYLWDIYSINNNGRLLKKYLIETSTAEAFFKLSPKDYPILSELSYFDYDLYTGDELKLLKEDLLQFSKNNYDIEIKEIVSIVDEAIKLNKAVLFDPFSY